MLEKRWLLSVIIISVLVIILFNTYYDIYRVSSGSMSPTIECGDYLLIKKNNESLFKREPYIGTDITRGKIYVFSIPLMKSNIKYYSGEENSKYVKRCVGVSGDTLQIKEHKLYINSCIWKEYYVNPIKNIDKNNYLNINNPIYSINLSKIFYPHDSTFSWNLNKIGPLYIPKENKKVKLVDSIKTLYKDIILLENKHISYNKILAKGKYTFKNHYYYFIGDNFYGSNDSRHWGMIPEENIIGEVKYIVWSRSNKYFFKRLQ